MCVCVCVCVCVCLCTGESCKGVEGEKVCHENAICHNELEGGVLCECLDGYRGDGFTSCYGECPNPISSPHFKILTGCFGFIWTRVGLLRLCLN